MDCDVCLGFVKKERGQFVSKCRSAFAEETKIKRIQ